MNILKCTRKFLSIIIVIVIMLSLGTTTYALDNSREKLYEQAKQVADRYSSESGKLQDPIELYNLNEEVAALFFASSEVGYVIVKLNDFSVPEYSTESNNMFITDVNAKYYYNGPLVYFKQVDGQILDLASNELLGTVQDIKGGLDEQAEASSITIFGADHTQNDKALRDAQLTDAGAAKAAATVDYIYGTVPNYSYNPDNICAATSSAMYLRYYDIYRNGSYVPIGLETSAGVLLTLYLTDYIPGNAVPYQVVNGLSSYLSDQGVSSGFMADVATTMYISSCVANDEPFIMLINNHPTYGNHYVTGYGYSFNSSGPNYAIVNNGWGSTGIYIDIVYANTIVHQ